MNAFANWLFSVLLGWTGTLANKVWNAVVNAAGGISDFFARFWLPLVLLLILAGTVLDYTVWFARWRPDLFWRSRFDRHRRNRYERRAAHSLDRTEMDDGTLSTIADWVAVPTDQSPIYALDSARQQYNPYMLPQEQQAAQQPYMAQEWQTAQPSYDAPPADAFSHYFTPVQFDAQEDGTALPYAGVAPPMDSFPYEDHDDPNAAWLPGSGYGEPYPQQADDTPMPSGSQRRRRSQREKHKPQPLHFLKDLRQRVTQPDDEEGMLDGLPSPVNRQDAFHEAVYPQSYHYRDPGSKTDGH